MGNYCFVEDGEVKYAGHLPKNGKTVSGLNKLSDAELKKHGWLPMVEVNPSYNQETHYRISPTIDIQEDQVVYNDVIVAFTAEEIKQNIWNDWINTMYQSDGKGMNFDTTTIGRVEEDLLDLIDEIDPNHLNKPKYAVIKARRKAKRDLRATKPPQP